MVGGTELRGLGSHHDAALDNPRKLNYHHIMINTAHETIQVSKLRNCNEHNIIDSCRDVVYLKNTSYIQTYRHIRHRR